MNPFVFPDELFIVKTILLGLFVGEDVVILAYVVFTQCQCVIDRQTDRQTDGQTDGRADRRTDNPTVANTGFCIASYAST